MDGVSFREPEWQVGTQGAERELAVSGDWIARETGLRDAAVAGEVLSAAREAKRILLSGRALGRWDSALVVFIRELRAAATALPSPIEIDAGSLPVAVRRLLALAGSSTAQAGERAGRYGLLTRMGRLTIRSGAEAVATAEMVGEMVTRGAAAIAGRTRARAGDLLLLMAEAGAGALLIVAICNGLVGAILAFIGAVQLRRFGAGVYVADLVAIATVREMAAVMTAIVMAGRTGGAYAAHIATMQGNEEIDALRTLGIPVSDYLVLPRIA